MPSHKLRDKKLLCWRCSLEQCLNPTYKCNGMLAQLAKTYIGAVLSKAPLAKRRQHGGNVPFALGLIDHAIGSSTTLLMLKPEGEYKILLFK